MKFFLDSANISEIKELSKTGMIDGVTTNPSLILKSGRNIHEVTKEICTIIDGPVSSEVTATETTEMLTQAKKLAAIAKNIAIKVPLTWNGLQACKQLTDTGVMVNVTLCFSANQALLAAKAGATFISPFIGRLDDINIEGIALLEEIRTIYDNYSITTEILAASIRTPNHLTQSALAGADIATIPPNIFRNLIKHPLTDQGLESFALDWEKTGQII
jgi:transaldolase